MRLRINWSKFEYYMPIKLRITDWEGCKTFKQNYLLIDSLMEYNGKMIELCVPFLLFINCVRGLRGELQEQIMSGKATFHLTRLHRKFSHGMKIDEVQLCQNNGS